MPHRCGYNITAAMLFSPLFWEIQWALLSNPTGPTSRDWEEPQFPQACHAVFWNHKAAARPRSIHVQSFLSMTALSLLRTLENQAGGQVVCQGSGPRLSHKSVPGVSPSARCAQGSLHQLSTMLPWDTTSACCPLKCGGGVFWGEADCYFQSTQDALSPNCPFLSHEQIITGLVPAALHASTCLSIARLGSWVKWCLRHHSGFQHLVGTWLTEQLSPREPQSPL